MVGRENQATPTFTSGDAFAIEIKPKQGWRLPSSDVNDFFRVKPFDATITTGTGKTMTTTTIIPTTTRETMTTTTKCSGIQEATRCRYCTMQFLKLRNRKIARRSFYCPIELFSGQPDRMLAALSALLECPQNNLRIFRNGDLIYGDHSSSISWVELKEQLFKGDMLQIVQQLLVASLLRDFSGVDVDSAVGVGVGGTADEATRGGRDGPSVDNEAVVGQPQPQFSGGNAKNKQEENVQEKKEDKKGFEKEEKKQKVVKHIDEEEEEYEEVAENELQDHLQRSSWRKEVGTQQITEARGQRLPKNCVLQKVLHLQLLALHNSTAMAAHNSSKTTARTTAETMMTSTTKTYRALKDLLSGHGSSDQVGEDLLQSLPPAQQYLLGATALDCSVMIAFQEVIGDRSSSMNPKTTIDPHLVHLDEFNRTFLVKVSLLDLDPKPDGHFEKYVRQTQEAYRCLQESLEHELEPGQCGK